MNAESPNPDIKPKLPVSAQLAAGWPLLLVVIGGLVGGACGGLAYGASLSLFKRKGVNAKTYIFTTFIGIGCSLLYIAAIVALNIAFPGLFKK